MSNLVLRYSRVLELYKKSLSFQYYKLLPTVSIFIILFCLIVANQFGMLHYGSIFGIMCAPIYCVIEKIVMNPIFKRHEKIKKLIYDSMNDLEKSELNNYMYRLLNLK